MPKIRKMSFIEKLFNPILIFFGIYPIIFLSINKPNTYVNVWEHMQELYKKM